jgi:hypothetical protein
MRARGGSYAVSKTAFHKIPFIVLKAIIAPSSYDEK